MEPKLEKRVIFKPAFDKRSPDPRKDYGVHGVEIVFILKGEQGAVQFLVYTHWMLSHVQKELDAKETDHLFCHPSPADLGYHSYVPRYEGQASITDNCETLDGKPCYYDGSGLGAIPIYQVLLKEGDDGVWRELELYYQQVFKVEELNTQGRLKGLLNQG